MCTVAPNPHIKAPVRAQEVAEALNAMSAWMRTIVQDTKGAQRLRCVKCRGPIGGPHDCTPHAAMSLLCSKCYPITPPTRDEKEEGK